MNKLLSALKIVQSLALTGFLIVLIVVGIRFYRITLPKIEIEADEANNLSLIAIQTTAQSRILLTNLNAYIPTTEKRLDRSLDNIDNLITKTSTTVNDIDVNEALVASQTQDSLKSLQSGIDGVRPVLDSLKKAADGIQPIETASTESLKAVGKTADAVTAQVSSESVVKTGQNIAAATGSLAKVADEGEQYFNHILHPKWMDTLIDWVERISIDVGRMFL